MRRLFWPIWLAGLLLHGSAVGVRGQTNFIYHRFRFFLHPDLVEGLSEAELKVRLSLYAQDLNAIFGKNTVQRFAFDPEADLTVTDSPPPIDYYPGDLPEANYELWVVANRSTVSNSGYMTFSTNGAGVAAGLYWDAVHDRTALSNAVPDDWDLWNYWRQIDTLAHEFAHVFGAASGEYYSLRNVPDTTATEPLENISYTDFGPTSDPYWSQHSDYWHDPMMVWTPRLTWNELISQVRFAHVTAAMINAGFRNVFPLSRQVPDLSSTRVVVVGDSQTLLSDTLVRAWKVMALPPFTSQLIFEGRTGGDGAAQFKWVVSQITVTT